MSNVWPNTHSRWRVFTTPSINRCQDSSLQSDKDVDNIYHVCQTVKRLKISQYPKFVGKTQHRAPKPYCIIFKGGQDILWSCRFTYEMGTVYKLIVFTGVIANGGV